MLKKMRLFERLLGCFILIAVLSGSVGGLGINYIRTLNEDYYNIVCNYGFVQKDISDASLHLQELLLSNNLHLHDQELVDFKHEFMEHHELVRPTVLHNEEELEIFNHIDEHVNEFFEALEHSDSHSEGSHEHLLELGNNIIEHYQELMDLKQEHGDYEISEIVRINRLTYIILIVMLIVALFVAIFLGVHMTRKVVRPIKDIRAAAIEIAKGNFDFEIEHKGEFEINDLTLTFEHMAKNTKKIISDVDNQLDAMSKNNFTIASEDPSIYVGEYTSIQKALENIREKLNSTLINIARAVQEVTLASGQVSDGAASLSEGSIRQASSVEEISASMADLNNHVLGVSEFASSATNMVQSSKDLIEDSNESMVKLVKAMEEIEVKSTKIGEIAKTIDDLAFQTNILALNAAIEAARAGQAGKGFSVVADEVRSLAGKSADAAQSTTMLINEAIEAIQMGVSMTNKTAASLNEAVEQASSVGEIVSKISSACEEQTIASEQLTKAIEEVSGVIQLNSATSEQSAAASVELSSQAAGVKKMIDEFKLR